LREKQDIAAIHIGNQIQHDERPLPERHEPRSKWLESVGHLAAVDGAVLLDSHLRVLGFGAFIEVADSTKNVGCISEAGKVEKRPAKDLGGGRHRSAVEFCSRFAPAAAIVVSEDGRISLIWATAHDEVFWVPMSILGFSDSILASSA
jgi:DisA bacterial checkpoint controller nucleotide-binding